MVQAVLKLEERPGRMHHEQTKVNCRKTHAEEKSSLTNEGQSVPQDSFVQ